jgi:hypothetical protein
MTLKTLCSLTLAAAIVAPSGAFARNHNNAMTALPVALADPSPSLKAVAPDVAMSIPLPEVALTGMVATRPAGPPPSVLEPLRRLSCVPYARVRSGLQIFGDAKLWWEKARNLYTQVTAPVAEAVMVFSGSSKIRRGHVAVVTAIVNPREIKVDHANWQNHGEIDLAMPVLDVSKNNDWSAVRVWNVNTNSFGTHVYRISGFITHEPVAR